MHLILVVYWSGRGAGIPCLTVVLVYHAWPWCWYTMPDCGAGIPCLAVVLAYHARLWCWSGRGAGILRLAVVLACHA